jgi:hypothetical protein
MSKVDLRVDFCSHEAAKYAVEHWHYSKCLPSGKIAKGGVWENDKFIGVVLFSWGANRNIGSPYGLQQTEVCELTRVALSAHVSPVSQVVTAAMRLLKNQSPGVRLIVSYADPGQGHAGTVYQAMNWIYVGMSEQTGGCEYFISGRWEHVRSLWAKHGTRSMDALDKFYPGVQKRQQPRKYKYLYPLDRAMRRQIEPLAKPYPKRANVGEIESRADTIG